MLIHGYKAVDPENGGSFANIADMQDAWLCIRDLLYLARCLGDDKDIQVALDDFRDFESGKQDPNEERDTHAGRFKSDCGVAYLETKRVMGEYPKSDFPDDLDDDGLRHVDYGVVSSIDIEAFGDGVRKAVLAGWELFGELSVICSPSGQRLYTRELVKYGRVPKAEQA
jgi:hypothetical protein